MVPPFDNTTPKDVNILTFVYDVRGEKIPASIEVDMHWLEPFRAYFPTLQELQVTLDIAPLGTFFPPPPQGQTHSQIRGHPSLSYTSLCL